LVRAELYRAGISAKDDAGATARLARETSRYNQELSQQEARLKRLGENTPQPPCFWVHQNGEGPRPRTQFTGQQNER
ncbi:hypothetical protein, partial [Escherichia coli]|uniref:hypothetical protein n=1 Tax=Escherichia coli TaxID=562 RepID=UPI003D337184